MPVNTSAPAITPQLVMWEFLNHFYNKLKVATFSASLPFLRSPAPIQTSGTLIGDYSRIAEMDKVAVEMAESVNRIAEAAGATHISFEVLDHSPGAEGFHVVTDNGLGVSVRMSWVSDVSTLERITRFDVCFRLWKLLPSALPEGA